MEYNIEFYDSSKENLWDDFIFIRSMNGTFLQSRKFLKYHPEGRFLDCSVLIYRKDKLVAVCPACIIFEEGDKVFVSHQGSTYGGLIIDASISRLELLFTLIDELEGFLKNNRFTKICLKPTMRIFLQSKN